MPLVDIVSHVPQPFPSMAVAFIEADQSGLPRSLSSKLVMLEKMVTRAVMVVRAAERTEGEVPFDLPVDTPVRVNRSADPSSAPRRSDESGDGSSDELRTAGGTSSPRTGRAGSAGSDASAGSAVRGSSGSGRSVGRMNSAPPPLPLEEDIYDNEQEAHYLDLIAAVEKGRGDPMVCPLPAKPYNGLPKYDVASVKMSGSGDSGTPSDAAVERPDEDSQELIYDYARDEDLDRLSLRKIKAVPPLLKQHAVMEDLEKEMKELREAIADVQLTVQSIKKSIQVCSCAYKTTMCTHSLIITGSDIVHTKIAPPISI